MLSWLLGLIGIEAASALIDVRTGEGSGGLGCVYVQRVDLWFSAGASTGKGDVVNREQVERVCHNFSYK